MMMSNNGIIALQRINVPACFSTGYSTKARGGASMAKIISCGIYKIHNTVNGNIYIGSSSDVADRWSTHKGLLRARHHHSPHLQSAWLLYGEECFQFAVIECCEKSSLREREQYYIDTLHPAYNISPTAGSPQGHKHTDEARRKISGAGKRLWEANREKMLSINIGRACSEETRAKISSSMMGKNKSGHKPDQRAIENMRAAQKGHSVSQEQREKLRVANTGKKASQESKDKASAAMFAFWKKKKDDSK
jgi:group I intron endonuclease